MRQIIVQTATGVVVAVPEVNPAYAPLAMVATSVECTAAEAEYFELHGEVRRLEVESVHLRAVRRLVATALDVYTDWIRDLAVDEGGKITCYVGSTAYAFERRNGQYVKC
jgi:hypothetical protein